MASSGYHLSIEKFGDGFIIVYVSGSRIRKVICNASYEVVIGSDQFLNGINNEDYPWISRLKNLQYVVCFDK